MTRNVERLMEKRKFTGQLILQNLSGMKVPLKSLYNINSVDQTADIGMNVLNRSRINRVKILGTQNSWAIIENTPQTKPDLQISVFDL